MPAATVLYNKTYSYTAICREINYTQFDDVRPQVDRHTAHSQLQQALQEGLLSPTAQGAECET